MKKAIQIDVLYKNYGTAYETSSLIVLCPWSVIIAILGAPDSVERNIYKYKRTSWTLEVMTNMRLRATGSAAELAALTQKLYEGSIKYNQIVLSQIYQVKTIEEYDRLKRSVGEVREAIPIIEVFRVVNNVRKTKAEWDLMAESLRNSV